MAIDRLAVVVTGLKEIDRKLARLAPAVQRRVVRRSMRAGLKAVAAAVKAEAPVDTGTMKAAVKVRAVRSRRRGSIQLEVRIEATDALKRTSSKTGRTVFYPALVQYGDERRPPDPFMTRAFTSTAETARHDTLRELRRGIEIEAARP